MEMRIAAQAFNLGLVVVTANLREFQRMECLHCKNWLH